ncbi:hypothetical protein BKA61DRAFT_200191 [Leptodontidium sp. MPI-SDFR-AT-0119]|nr:hypothetical protein BKA61DRAFT_200191 [Leptodontidium sp. MPI-SDFR-AT-0119]
MPSQTKARLTFLPRACLVCVQVLWVAGQAIERKVAGLPISLLEYHTLVHVVCALVMYVLWFQKSYDIQYPTLVGTQDFPEALGFIVASSRWIGNSGFTSNRPKLRLGIEKEVRTRDEDPIFHWFGSMDHPTSRLYSRNDVGPGDSHDLDPRVLGRRFDLHPSIQRTVFWNFSLISLSSTCVLLWTRQTLRTGLVPGLLESYRVDLSDKDLLRLDLAGKFIVKLINLLETPLAIPKPTYEDPQENLVGRPLAASWDVFCPGVLHPYGLSLIAFRAANTAGYHDVVDRISNKAINVLFATLFGILSAYGAIHLAAMHSTFPTTVELTLWKSSCCILLGTAGMAALLFVLLGYTTFTMYQSGTLENLFLAGIGLIVLLIYASARGFIVLESFISLRHMPSGVYQTPKLGITDYIPHI